MLNQYYEKKKEKYIDEIIKITQSESLKDKHLLLRNKLNAYSVFCYKHNISEFSSRLDDNVILNNSYIIESTPDIVEVDQEVVNNAIAHLKEVLENNKNGLIEGITEEEANLILEYVIQMARNNLAEDLKNKNINLLTYHLSGHCGLSQALTMMPLQELGIKVCINNATDFPNNRQRHGFGIANFPIKSDNKVYEKPYLVDVSYRQFFTTLRCVEARFYTTNVNCKDKVGPDAGYYVCLTEEGRKFAKTLLKRGFVPWTEETAKIYGGSFVCSSTVNLTNLYAYHQIKAVSEQVYFNSVFHSSEILDYTKEELENWGFQLDLEEVSRTH